MIYLYIKQHSITGLKYFGRTTSINPFEYPGTGVYWKSHWKKHGRQYIKTLEIWGFDNQELCTEFALKFSKDNNIAKSKKWANLIPENGKDGGNTSKGKDHHMYGRILSEETRKKMSKSRQGKNNPFYGKKHTNKTKNKIIKSLKALAGENHFNRGSKRNEETKRKMSIRKKGRKRYYSPDGSKYGVYFPGTEPDGYVLKELLK